MNHDEINKNLFNLSSINHSLKDSSELADNMLAEKVSQENTVIDYTVDSKLLTHLEWLKENCLIIK